ncbi:13085_t:CDS:2 [Ambispora gerdemannii]|uniref:13085_t:CDS:1 n=1 Tax=Ambispora gerdemannii TaxID=144530 RepID=A0A9N9FB10_9GLOM|nr:13085_t:CDS:2 [Ambispora gerdemannii]
MNNYVHKDQTLITGSKVEEIQGTTSQSSAQTSIAHKDTKKHLEDLQKRFQAVVRRKEEDAYKKRKIQEEQRSKKRKINDLRDVDETNLDRENDLKTRKIKNHKWSFTTATTEFTPLPQGIAHYIGMNSQLKGVDHGRLNPKGTLEKQLDQAIKEGNLGLATKLSDEIAEQDHKKTVKEAIERKEFAEAKQREEKARANRKKPKLKWGFETKQRWETKSNM